MVHGATYRMNIFRFNVNKFLSYDNYISFVNAYGFHVNQHILLEGWVTTNINLGWIILDSLLNEIQIKFISDNIHLILTL